MKRGPAARLLAAALCPQPRMPLCSPVLVTVPDPGRNCAAERAIDSHCLRRRGQQSRRGPPNRNDGSSSVSPPLRARTSAGGRDTCAQESTPVADPQSAAEPWSSPRDTHGVPVTRSAATAQFSAQGPHYLLIAMGPDHTPVGRTVQTGNLTARSTRWAASRRAPV